MTFKEGNRTRIIMPGGTIPWKHRRKVKEKEVTPRKPQHANAKVTFGEVYTNDLAKTELEKKRPKFPVGSIIVREKNLTKTSEKPEVLIAMVKRKKGFSKKTGNWEFIVLDGKDLLMEKRETKGNCAECHSSAKKTDWGLS